MFRILDDALPSSVPASASTQPALAPHRGLSNLQLTAFHSAARSPLRAPSNDRRPCARALRPWPQHLQPTRYVYCPPTLLAAVCARETPATTCEATRCAHMHRRACEATRCAQMHVPPGPHEVAAARWMQDPRRMSRCSKWCIEHRDAAWLEPKHGERRPRKILICSDKHRWQTVLMNLEFVL